MDSGKEMTRSLRQASAAYRAQLRLKQRFESIDFELDILQPKLNEIKNGMTTGHLPEFTIELEEKPVKRLRK